MDYKDSKSSSEITTAEYLEYVRKHGDAAQTIPTMNLFTIKQNQTWKAILLEQNQELLL